MTVLAIVGEIEEADAICAAFVGEVGGGMQVLAGGSAEGKDIVAFCDFVAFPEGVAEFKVERGPLRLGAYRC